MKYIFLLLTIFTSLVSFSQVTVTLDGSGSDSDGSISGFTWRQISGPAQVAINTATSAKPSIVFTVAGVYVFGLIVTDNLGLKSTEDQVQVTINAANVRPKANAGPDQSISLPSLTKALREKQNYYVWVGGKSLYTL